MSPGRLAQQDGRDVLTEYLLYPHSGTGGLGDTAAQTGLVLQGLLVTMVTFSCPCIRQSGHFQVGLAAAPGDLETLWCPIL